MALLPRDRILDRDTQQAQDRVRGASTSYHAVDVPAVHRALNGIRDALADPTRHLTPRQRDELHDDRNLLLERLFWLLTMDGEGVEP